MCVGIIPTHIRYGFIAWYISTEEAVSSFFIFNCGFMGFEEQEDNYECRILYYNLDSVQKNGYR
jgi:hypothetical protein